MAAVLGFSDSHLFELHNFQANELLYRERHSNETKPARGKLSERSRQGGPSGDLQVTSAAMSCRTPTLTAIVESPRLKPTSYTARAGGPTAGTTPTTVAVESLERALSLQMPSGNDEAAVSMNEICPKDLGAGRTQTEGVTDRNDGVLATLEEATLGKLARMVAREMESCKKAELPIRLNDFTGEKSPYLAEDAIVWLKKLRLLARHYDWDHAVALEIAAVHLKGLAARWFVSVEKHMNDELHLEKDRWNYFHAKFEERFADFRSRLLQVEKIKDLKLRHGEDVREYAESIMSINCRLEEPLDDEFLRWVFIQGLPPSELRDKLYKFEERPRTLASAVKFARRFQLSQSVFNMKDSPSHIPTSASIPTHRISPGSKSTRSN